MDSDVFSLQGKFSYSSIHHSIQKLESFAEQRYPDFTGVPLKVGQPIKVHREVRLLGNNLKILLNIL